MLSTVNFKKILLGCFLLLLFFVVANPRLSFSHIGIFNFNIVSAGISIVVLLYILATLFTKYIIMLNKRTRFEIECMYTLKGSQINNHSFLNYSILDIYN